MACIGAIAWTEQAGRAERCSGATEELRVVWNDAQREAVRSALLASQPSYAAATAMRVEEALDVYADEWIAGHRSACQATAVDATQSTEVMDLRMACLHRRKVELQAVVDVLVRADAQVVERAVQLATTLPPVSHCADVPRLQAEEPAPEHPRDAAKVERVRVLLAEAGALHHAGKYEGAREKLDEAEPLVAEVPYPRLRLELNLIRASVLMELERYVASESASGQALASALAVGTTADAVGAMADLALLVGNRQSRVDEGICLARLAAATAAFSSPEMEARAQSSLGAVLYVQGRLLEAEAALRRAWELYRSTLGSDHLRTIGALVNLGGAVALQGRHPEAESLQRDGLTRLESALGADHPAVGVARSNLGISLQWQRKYDAAEREHRRAFAVFETALGFRDSRTLWSRENLARVLEAQGRAQEAEREYRIALGELEATVGRDDPEVVEARIALGNSLVQQERHQAAEAEYRRALSILEKVEAGRGPITTDARVRLGHALIGQNRFAEAETAFREALAASEGVLVPEHSDIVHAQIALGELLVRSGSHREARDLLTQAWIHRNASTPPEEWARGGFELAKLLWRSKPDRPHALEIAEQSKAGFEEAKLTEKVREVEQWLARHRHPAPSRSTASDG